ncbi:hypothetical protein PG984_003037 [Apiospora sp. TS-2023a]
MHILSRGVSTDLPSLLFTSPVEAAAFRGNTEALRPLLSYHHSDSSDSKSQPPENDIIRGAGTGNQLPTLETILRPEYPNHNMALVYAVYTTTSLDVFKRLLPLAMGKFQEEPRDYYEPDHFESKFVPRRIWAAALHGCIPIIHYLLHLDLPGPPNYYFQDGSKWKEPLGRAASCGHTHVVVYLLNKGFHVTNDSLLAGVKGARRMW